MSRQRALQVVVGVRERRTRALDEAVSQAKQACDDAREAEEAAQDAVQAATDRADDVRQKFHDMTAAGQCVDVTSLMGREHQLERVQAEVVQARKALDQRVDETRQCDDALRHQRAEAQRNRQKIEALHEELRLLRQAQQQHEDDEQDEESEEAAISRMISATRAQALEPVSP